MSKVTLNGEYPSGKVWLNGQLLSPEKSRKVVDHSPDGFAWGYGGSGPAQLALAVLLELTDEPFALEAYADFKWHHIATLDFECDFEINFDTTDVLPACALIPKV
jgi:hypothetical protein